MDKKNYREQKQLQGPKFVLECQENISIKKAPGKHTYQVKCKQKNVREFHKEALESRNDSSMSRRQGREQIYLIQPPTSKNSHAIITKTHTNILSPSSPLRTDKSIQQTEFQLQALNKTIEDEIHKLELFRGYLSEKKDNPHPNLREVHVETSTTSSEKSEAKSFKSNRTNKHNDMTWREKLEANRKINKYDGYVIDKSYRCTITTKRNKDDEAPPTLPRFRTIGIKQDTGHFRAKRAKITLQELCQELTEKFKDLDAKIDTKNESREQAGCTYGQVEPSHCNIYPCGYTQTMPNFCSCHHLYTQCSNYQCCLPPYQYCLPTTTCIPISTSTLGSSPRNPCDMTATSMHSNQRYPCEMQLNQRNPCNNIKRCCCCHKKRRTSDLNTEDICRNRNFMKKLEENDETAEPSENFERRRTRSRSKSPSNLSNEGETSKSKRNTKKMNNHKKTYDNKSINENRKIDDKRKTDIRNRNIDDTHNRKMDDTRNRKMNGNQIMNGNRKVRLMDDRIMEDNKIMNDNRKIDDIGITDNKMDNKRMDNNIIIDDNIMDDEIIMNDNRIEDDNIIIDDNNRLMDDDNRVTEDNRIIDDNIIMDDDDTITDDADIIMDDDNRIIDSNIIMDGHRVEDNIITDDSTMNGNRKLNDKPMLNRVEVQRTKTITIKNIEDPSAKSKTEKYNEYCQKYEEEHQSQLPATKIGENINASANQLDDHNEQSAARQQSAPTDVRNYSRSNEYSQPNQTIRQNISPMAASKSMHQVPGENLIIDSDRVQQRQLTPASRGRSLNQQQMAPIREESPPQQPRYAAHYNVPMSFAEQMCYERCMDQSRYINQPRFDDYPPRYAEPRRRSDPASFAAITNARYIEQLSRECEARNLEKVRLENQYYHRRYQPSKSDYQEYRTTPSYNWERGQVPSSTYQQDYPSQQYPEYESEMYNREIPNIRRRQEDQSRYYNACPCPQEVQNMRRAQVPQTQTRSPYRQTQIAPRNMDMQQSINNQNTELPIQSQTRPKELVNDFQYEKKTQPLQNRTLSSPQDRQPQMPLIQSQARPNELVNDFQSENKTQPLQNRTFSSPQDRQPQMRPTQEGSQKPPPSIQSKAMPKSLAIDDKKTQDRQPQMRPTQEGSQKPPPSIQSKAMPKSLAIDEKKTQPLQTTTQQNKEFNQNTFQRENIPKSTAEPSAPPQTLPIQFDSYMPEKDFNPTKGHSKTSITKTFTTKCTKILTKPLRAECNCNFRPETNTLSKPRETSGGGTDQLDQKVLNSLGVRESKKQSNEELSSDSDLSNETNNTTEEYYCAPNKPHSKVKTTNSPTPRIQNDKTNDINEKNKKGRRCVEFDLSDQNSPINCRQQKVNNKSRPPSPISMRPSSYFQPQRYSPTTTVDSVMVSTPRTVLQQHRSTDLCTSGPRKLPNQSIQPPQKTTSKTFCCSTESYSTSYRYNGIDLNCRESFETDRIDIDWGRSLRDRHLPPLQSVTLDDSTDYDFDNANTHRTVSSCSTLKTCMESDYAGDYSTCEESQDDGTKNLPEFTGCPCLYETFKDMARPYEKY